MSKRQEIRDRQARKQRTERTVVIVIVVALVLVAALFLIVPALMPAGEIAQPTEAVTRPQVTFNGMGDPNAPVKIIEYSDFQCPYCARFSAETEPKLIEAYIKTGKVYFEYHSFGEFIGPESRRSAEAAYCAGDQKKFWEMHDLIFANHTGENVGDYTDKRLKAFAEKLGLDMGTFNTCFDNNKYADQVKQDGLDGAQAGVQATPSFTINGKLFEGAQPFEAFQKEIDALLK
jgi:protein-disulfide isomerase